MRREDRAFRRTRSIKFRGQLRSSEPALVMGIVNMTPDSFYKDSRVSESSALLAKVEEMISDGMDILDIGGASSRPGAELPKGDEELSRVLPGIESIRNSFPNLLMSIDTLHWSVAKQAVLAGVDLVNDISGGLYDPLMIRGVAEAGVAYCCMHMKGIPSTMEREADYQDVLLEVNRYFSERIEACKKAGIHDLILDPGFGFGKGSDHNFNILNELEHISSLGLPLLVGLSRKRMIYENLDITPETALNGTTALHMIALEKGVNILRVHDVKEAAECVKIHRLLKGPG